MSDESKPNQSPKPASDPTSNVKTSVVNKSVVVKAEELVDTTLGHTTDKGGVKSNPNGVGLMDI